MQATNSRQTVAIIGTKTLKATAMQAEDSKEAVTGAAQNYSRSLLKMKRCG